MARHVSILLGALVFCAAFPASAETYDVLIRNGTIYDGSGGAPFSGDVAINGDTITAIGTLPNARGRQEIDARGLAIAPGFINMLSWANESLIADGRSQSDIRQGVTLEIMGEGESMGPLNAGMKKDTLDNEGDIKFDVPWTTLGEYLDYLAQRGVSPNIASFVGATTVRVHEIGYANARRIGAHEIVGRAGHGGRRAGRRLGADLRARILCEDR